MALLTAQQPLAVRDPAQTPPLLRAASWDFSVMCPLPVLVSLPEHHAQCLPGAGTVAQAHPEAAFLSLLP